MSFQKRDYIFERSMGLKQSDHSFSRIGVCLDQAKHGEQVILKQIGGMSKKDLVSEDGARDLQSVS